MLWFTAAAVSVLLFLATARTVIAPVFTESGGIEYLLVGPSRLELLLLAGAAFAIVLALRVWVSGISRARSRREQVFEDEREARPKFIPDEFSGGATAENSSGKNFGWLAPLCLLSLSGLSLLAFVPALARLGPSFVFIGEDMRGWILLATVLLMAREMDTVAGGRLSARLRLPARWTSAARLLAWDAAIFVVLLAWAILTQPIMRFASEPHGDEPKYLRYAENWYQGNGFDLNRKQRISDMPLDAPTGFWRNVPVTMGALAEEARNFASDARGFVSAPTEFRWNRARGGDNWFVTGKQGGLYQAHTPGISAVIFPGYVIDRHFLDLDTGHQGEIPGGLFMTNVVLLVVYAVWGVAVFRLLRRIFGQDEGQHGAQDGGHDALAAGLAVLAMITLPVTSFAFQLYPETFAGLALTLVLSFLLFPRDGGSTRRAIAFGLLCGFLPWAHIRLSLLSAVAILYALLPRAGEWRQRRAFIAGYALMVALMCAYAYRLTGAPMPNAMFSAEGTADPFDASLIAPFFAGYMVDRIWGILPHVPIYLLAFLGLGPLWRGNRAHFLLFTGLYLSLAIPSAAHSLNAAGATPGRHLVAVIPLAMWPLGLAIREWRSSRIFRTAFVTLTLLSLQAALAYNWWHTKDTGRMWDVSISGWKVNLLFAWTHGDVWAASTGNFVLFLIGVVGIVALILIGVVGQRHKVGQNLEVGQTLEVGVGRSFGSGSVVRNLAIGLVLTAFAGAGASALTGDSYRDDYTQHPLVSRREALARLAGVGECTLCAVSTRGEVNEVSLTWNGVEQFDVYVAPMPNLSAEVRIVVNARDREPGYGRVRIEFGDGVFSPELPVAGTRRLTHTYRAAGAYTVRAWLTLPDGTRRETYTEVIVR